MECFQTLLPIILGALLCAGIGFDPLDVEGFDFAKCAFTGQGTLKVSGSVNLGQLLRQLRFSYRVVCGPH
jgi:hypothetical protein